PGLAFEALFFLFEIADEIGFGTADGMTRARFYQDGVIGGKGHFLETGQNGAGLNDLLGEQVSGAEQDAHLDAALDEGLRQGGDHGAAKAVVDTTGENDVDARGLLPGQAGVQKHADHGFPENKAAARADVAATLPPFENEGAGAFAEKRFEHARRGNVQVSDNAAGFERAGLIGPAAGDDGEGRPDLFHHFQLFGAQLAFHKTQDAD